MFIEFLKCCLLKQFHIWQCVRCSELYYWWWCQSRGLSNLTYVYMYVYSISKDHKFDVTEKSQKVIFIHINWDIVYKFQNRYYADNISFRKSFPLYIPVVLHLSGNGYVLIDNLITPLFLTIISQKFSTKNQKILIRTQKFRKWLIILFSLQKWTEIFTKHRFVAIHCW